MNTMNAKHTPPPWVVSQLHGMHSGRAANEFGVLGASGCIAITPNRSNADNAANARLIAAAPKLLTALIELVRISTPPASPVQDLAVQAALAAIAEARGES